MKGGYAFHNRVNLSILWDGTPGSLFMASQITEQLNHNYGLIMSSHSTPLQNKMLTPSCMLFRVFKTELQLLHEWIIDLLLWDLRFIFHVRNVRFFFFNRFESQNSSGSLNSWVWDCHFLLVQLRLWSFMHLFWLFLYLLIWCLRNTLAPLAVYAVQGNICPRAAALRCKDIQSSTFVALQNWWFEPSLIRFQHGSVWSNVEAEKMLLPQRLFLLH